MPNHVHAIVWLRPEGEACLAPTSLSAFVGGFKAAVSRRVGQRIWQRSFYDRVIRNENEFEALTAYIADNPRRWTEDIENPEYERGRGMPRPYAGI
jgi:putative transposase